MIVSGKVIKGEAVGRTIGFPTANLKLSHKPVIEPGVYASLVTLKRKQYLSLAYFGPRHVFGQLQDNFEVFIFNFNQDIYGQTLSVKLFRLMRPPKKVANLAELKKLLVKDLADLDNYVILVDKNDQPFGIEKKQVAHVGRAMLHRAISVQLFNPNGELLIQQRSIYKPLFPLQWANTVCTDVRPYETYLQAAERRLKEEMGLSVPLTEKFKFFYSAKWLGGGEREIDQVFCGQTKSDPKPDKREIKAWRFVSLAEAKKQLKEMSPWFQIILKRIKPSDIVGS